MHACQEFSVEWNRSYRTAVLAAVLHCRSTVGVVGCQADGRCGQPAEDCPPVVLEAATAGSSVMATDDLASVQLGRSIRSAKDK